MHDPRLLGTWRSDAKRTWRELNARSDIPAKNRRALRRFFGKLELRFTRVTCYSTLNGDTMSDRYKVVAKDSSSVAVVSDSLVGEVISHFHFDGPYMWVLVGGMFREFFKRCRPSNTRLHRGRHSASREGQSKTSKPPRVSRRR